MVVVRPNSSSKRNGRGILGFASGINAKSYIILGLTMVLFSFSCCYIYIYNLHINSHHFTTSDEAAGNWRRGSSLFHRLEGMSNGFSWKVIDWQHPFSADEESRFTCTWTHFQSFLSRESAPMCVHDDDAVSNSIKGNKRWSDCDILPVLWNNGSAESYVYVEIGANIGSCLMEMLLSTNASIIAFEPHPMNLYNIKKTVSLLGESYQDRLTLFPLGLGNASATSTIYSATGNMGNSGKVISDHPGQVFDQKNQFTVHVERLDSILAASKMKIGLMKMDAQGFECRIVEGMGDVAEIIDVMKFEYAYPWLHSHGCFDLVSLLMKNFDIYTGFHDGVFSGLTNDIEVSANTNTVFDLFASKRNS
ncbi:hypothetical protein ACHAWU_008661 [Discostella pseudostelligera]|uniref:Methyltransferase FkbM domain-containing protein n=1 Tax=Discostella pseudostelligera TaxID=259834 RepID=A0ABD3MA10_9STRA